MSEVTEQALITDHSFRMMAGTPGKRTGEFGGPAVQPGMCAYRGTCDQPPDAHARQAQRKHSHGGPA